ncbi:MAG: hypothetical protein HN778_14785 [Prolixibacteraceae bacterium]|jgi:hypothetical protein|nr:hypothetical protein [Prolixibacteraceae bacterium]MBT6764190.1 hypothetical protein [Prolixibacteraceae bacterium]MBT6999141.1 hypothetical protein [Prolixibacteraceae bacterium]MBT7396095.1 hypothetical protein [Prolixibacteraceae bacterium]
MKRILILIIFLVNGLFLQAQGFNQAVGIRGGLSSGFEYRFFTDDANSYKLLLSTRDRGLQLHAFKEFHQYDWFEFSDQLVFFYGAGIHAGFESWDIVRYQYNTSWHETRTALLAGIDGLVGIEYVFYEAPISFGIEVKPYFDVFGREIFKIQLFDFAFTLKYLF